MLRGRRDAYHCRGFGVGLVTVLACAPLQVVIGEWAARVVEARQPAQIRRAGRHRTHDIACTR